MQTDPQNPSLPPRPAAVADPPGAASKVLHREPVRVYWEDTDAGGVVFYANYLKFFERARTEWLRTLGFAQQRLREQTGLIFIVSQTDVRYRRPARLDEQLELTVALRDLRGASLRIAQQAWRGDTLLAEGDIRIGCVRADDFKPQRLPAPLLAALAAYCPHAE